jgi:hypothetical protein
VTEADWNACTDPKPMIRFMELERMGTCRQLRLFGAACCRRLRQPLDDGRIRRIIEAAEGYADGLTSAAELRAAHRRSSTLCQRLRITHDAPRATCVLANAAIAANWVSASDARFRTSDRINSIVPGGYAAAAAAYIAGAAVDAAFYAAYEGADAMALVGRRNIDGASTPADPIWAAEEEAQSRLLRCVVGNPFRQPASGPSVLAWDSGAVVKMAEAIYDRREMPAGTLDAARLAVLADALEEAGCTDPDLLKHLRGPGPHYRGCFVLDLLLGKR